MIALLPPLTAKLASRKSPDVVPEGISSGNDIYETLLELFVVEFPPVISASAIAEKSRPPAKREPKRPARLNLFIEMKLR
jgi:hypothetical protein